VLCWQKLTNKKVDRLIKLLKSKKPDLTGLQGYSNHIKKKEVFYPTFFFILRRDVPVFFIKKYQRISFSFYV